MTLKILISDSVSPKAVEIFRKTGCMTVDVRTQLTPVELKACIPEYDGWVVRSATKVTADLIAAADRLKVVGRAGAGVDNIDVAAASKRGIVVMNTPGGNTIAAAELALSMMLSLCRKIPQASASMKAGRWEKNKFLGIEVCNRTLGVIGLGRIGTIVAGRAQGLKMKVLGYDPLITKEAAAQGGIELVPLEELFRRADIITVHTPLNAETRNLLDASAFEKMKDGVFIVNCARGGIVHEGDLYEALAKGKVGGAALDVFTEEPPKPSPLLTMDQVILTPHLGASTEEAQESVALLVAEQMASYLIQGTIRNAVNVPSVSGEVLATIQPFLDLAERLGRFVEQLETTGMEEILVEYSGQVSESNTDPMTVAFLKGLLGTGVEEGVNFVNAPILAKERGIQVTENKTSTAGDYSSLIQVKIKTPGETVRVAGTIFGKKEPRVVRVNQFTLEAIPEGHMLLVNTNDRPGVVGNIGTTLGESGINIGQMQFGRELKEGKSLVVLNTDQRVNGEVVEKLRRLPNVLSVHRFLM